MIAASNGNKEVVKLLLEKDSDIEVKDKDGKTALDLASDIYHKEIITLLINHSKKKELTKPSEVRVNDISTSIIVNPPKVDIQSSNSIQEKRESITQNIPQSKTVPVTESIMQDIPQSKTVTVTESNMQEDFPPSKSSLSSTAGNTSVRYPVIEKQHQEVSSIPDKHTTIEAPQREIVDVSKVHKDADVANIIVEIQPEAIKKQAQPITTSHIQVSKRISLSVLDDTDYIKRREEERTGEVDCSNCCIVL